MSQQILRPFDRSASTGRQVAGRSLLTLRALPSAALLLAALLSAPVDAQQVPWAMPAAGGQHNLITLDETGSAVQIVLSHVAFQPIQLAGHARWDDLRNDIPVPQGGGLELAHVRLPTHGSLYFAQTGGQSALIQIDALGAVHLRVSVAGLLEHIAVSRSGQHALVATTLAAGGDLLCIDLATTATPLVLTSALPAQDIDGVSLRLGDGDAWWVADGSLFHADLAGAGGVRVVSTNLAATDVLEPELATSFDTSHIAFVSTMPTGLRHLHAAAPTGPATQISLLPGAFDLPGLDLPVGPLLAVSNDGSHIAWRRTVTTSELFARRVDQPATEVQLTGDALFIDTIDSVGVLGFIGPNTLVFTAGEVTGDPETPLGKADVFMLDLQSPGPASPVNLTQTSGVLTAPFIAPGDIELKQGLIDPSGERMLLLVDPANGDDAVLSVALDGSTGLTTLLDELVSPPELVRVGDHVLIIDYPEPPPGAPPGTVVQLVHLLAPLGDPAGLSLIGGASGPGALTIDRFTDTRDGTRAAFVVSLVPGIELAVWLDLVTGTLTQVWNILAVTPQIAFSSSGRLSLGLGLAGGGPYVSASFGAPYSGFAFPIGVNSGFPLQY
jgi:hypothetical protein